MRVVALTFHDIVAEEKARLAHQEPFYCVTTMQMEALLSRLRKLGYRTMSSKAFRACQQGIGDLPERSVVMTFDDGFASNLEVAVPLLIRYRFTGTFFITVQNVGKSGYLSWEQVRKLAFLGMEIGSHGMSHRPLTQMAPSELEEELVSSKRILEEQLGIPVRALAVPGGSWNRSVARAAKQAGYDAVWVSNIGMNGLETNPQALRRVVVRQPFSADKILSMVQGWQLSFWWAVNQQHLIRILKRLLGVYWYERLKRLTIPNA